MCLNMTIKAVRMRLLAMARGSRGLACQQAHDQSYTPLLPFTGCLNMMMKAVRVGLHAVPKGLACQLAHSLSVARGRSLARSRLADVLGIFMDHHGSFMPSWTADCMICKYTSTVRADILPCNMDPLSLSPDG